MKLSIKRNYIIKYEVKYCDTFCDCGGKMDYTVLEVFDELEKAIIFIEGYNGKEELTLNVTIEKC